MRGMKYVGTAFAATAFVLSTLPAAAGPTQLAAAPAGQAAIDARVDLMKNELAKPSGAIKAYVQDGKGTPAEVAAHAAALSAAADKIAVLFPAGTGRGDFDDKATRALPAIWSDWSGFEAAAVALRDEADKLAKVAAGGDKDAITAQYALVGKNGCGTCHKSFRGDKAK